MRWDFLDLPPLTEPAASRVRHGAYLPAVEMFDASFISISQAEAAVLDPQHRIRGGRMGTPLD